MDEVEHAEVVALIGEAKFAAETFHADVADDEIGLRGGSIGDDGALDAGNDRLDVGFLEAKYGGAVKRNAIHKFGEDGLNFLERRILVEMFAVDGGDDGDDGRVIEEAAVAFVGF